MPDGVEIHNPAAEACNPLTPLGGECGRSRVHLAGGARCKEPHRVVEEGGLAVGRAAYFLARHRVAWQEARMAGLIEPAVGAGGNLALGAADVGEQLIWL